MEKDNTQNSPCRAPETDEEINLLDYLLVLARQKRMILWTMFATFLLTCGATLLLSNIYTSTSRVLPPSNGKGGLPAALGDVGDLASLAGISLGSTTGEMFVGILQSRTVADALIDRFGLMDAYGAKSRVAARKKLDKRTTISQDENDRIIAVSVEDVDPVRAAAMANAYVEELKRINVQLNLSSAGRERVFLEKRLKKVKADLRQAENALKNFQEDNRAIKIDSQAAAIIEAIGSLKGELASKEVELGVLRSYQTRENPQVKALQETIDQLKAQIRKLESSPEGQKVSGDIFIATSEMPGLGVRYGRLLRELKVQETLFELLTRQYELAKLSEAKNTSSLQILDEAVPADKKSKPSRALIVLGATFVMGFFAVITAFLREYFERLPERDQRRWAEIKRLARFRKAGDSGKV